MFNLEPLILQIQLFAQQQTNTNQLLTDQIQLLTQIKELLTKKQHA